LAPGFARGLRILQLAVDRDVLLERLLDLAVVAT
jgi:hypothetical protein